MHPSGCKHLKVIKLAVGLIEHFYPCKLKYFTLESEVTLFSVINLSVIKPISWMTMFQPTIWRCRSDFNLLYSSMTNSLDLPWVKSRNILSQYIL